jgi:chromosome condensin MukBEF MukE localization factor
MRFKCIAGEALIIPQVILGAGKHIDQIEPHDFQTAFKLNFVTQPIYLIAIMLVKESVGFFLLRIAATPFYRRTIISVMGA